MPQKGKIFSDGDVLRCYLGEAQRNWEDREIYRCHFARGDIIHDAGDYERVDLSKCSGRRPDRNYPSNSMKPDLAFAFETPEGCEEGSHPCEIRFGSSRFPEELRCSSECAR
jgi:hypothetical protein